MHPCRYQDVIGGVELSYDLNFWEYSFGPLKNHQDTYERPSNGERVKGLVQIDVERILEDFSSVSTRQGFARLDDLNYEKDGEAFQITITDQFLRVDCYGVSIDNMNEMIEIAKSHRLPLYDPQVESALG